MTRSLSIAKKLYAMLENSPQKEWGNVCSAFALFIREQRFMRLAPKIVEAFEQYAFERQNKKSVRVESAESLSTALHKALPHQLQEKLGIEAVIEESIRPELLGGMRIIAGDRVIDASIRRKLQQILES